MEKNKVITYSDGGSRGNPGQAAIGIVVDGKPFGERIGIATNNEAEYKALIFALRKVKHLFGEEKCAHLHIESRMDSELLVKQLNGEYRVKHPNLQPLFLEVLYLKKDFASIKFVHVRRELNKEADAMVNLALDRE